MSNSIFNDVALKAASLGLDGLSARQRATANNIANIDTPGYKAQHVHFEDQLRQAIYADKTLVRQLPTNNQAFYPSSTLGLQTTSARHLQPFSAGLPNARIIERPGSSLRNDENNVDIDLEMTTLAETGIRYRALTQLAGSKLSLLRSMIREGR